MIEVELPATIRAALNLPTFVEVDGTSVGEALESLCQLYPTVRPRLMTDTGTLHRFVNLYVDNVDVRELDGIRTSVFGAKRVRVLSAISGG